jgi:hypothetical protein
MSILPARVVLAVKKSEFEGADVDGFRHVISPSGLAAGWPERAKILPPAGNGCNLDLPAVLPEPAIFAPLLGIIGCNK